MQKPQNEGADMAIAGPTLGKVQHQANKLWDLEHTHLS